MIRPPCWQGGPHVLTPVHSTSSVMIGSLPLGGEGCAHRPAALRQRVRSCPPPANDW
jgi:hypothetical protein